MATHTVVLFHHVQGLTPGVTDLGGNTAKGNGNTPQCVGVVCTTS